MQGRGLVGGRHPWGCVAGDQPGVGTAIPFSSTPPSSWVRGSVWTAPNAQAQPSPHPRAAEQLRRPSSLALQRVWPAWPQTKCEVYVCIGGAHGLFPDAGKGSRLGVYLAIYPSSQPWRDETNARYLVDRSVRDPDGGDATHGKCRRGLKGGEEAPSQVLARSTLANGYCLPPHTHFSASRQALAARGLPSTRPLNTGLQEERARA